METKNIGTRPETAFIIDKMKNKNINNVNTISDKKTQVFNFDQQLEYELNPYSNKNIEIDEKYTDYESSENICKDIIKYR